MLKTTADLASEQQQRLDLKTQDQRLINEVVNGTGISPWEAEVLVDIVKEIYFTDHPNDRPLRTGQIRYECVRGDQGAGKALKECQLISTTLTLIEREDIDLLRQKGHAACRILRIQRLTEEAREQGGLLSQEDLALLLSCDVRTIRRDIAQLRKETGIFVATRGQQKDIGPGVTHKAVAVRHWLEGKEPLAVANAIHHSLKSVERYIQTFSRVVFLAQKGFPPLQSAFTIGISTASVIQYLELYNSIKHRPEYQPRLQELRQIGAAHFQAHDEKKGALLQRENTTTAWRKP